MEVATEALALEDHSAQVVAEVVATGSTVLVRVTVDLMVVVLVDSHSAQVLEASVEAATGLLLADPDHWAQVLADGLTLLAEVGAGLGSVEDHSAQLELLDAEVGAGLGSSDDQVSQTTGVVEAEELVVLVLVTSTGVVALEVLDDQDSHSIGVVEALEVEVLVTSTGVVALVVLVTSTGVVALVVLVTSTGVVLDDQVSQTIGVVEAMVVGSAFFDSVVDQVSHWTEESAATAPTRPAAATATATDFMLTIFPDSIRPSYYQLRIFGMVFLVVCCFGGKECPRKEWRGSGRDELKGVVA